MSIMLKDGTIIPSIFQTNSSEQHKSQPNSENFDLKVGTVSAIYYPDSRENNRKTKIEYDVEVKERRGEKGFTVSKYRRCIISNLFGGLADTLDFTLRPSIDTTRQDPMFNDGSTVLILCLYGDTSQAYIVGGSKHNASTKIDSSSRGHFLEFEFNGVNFEINKDGEMTITYKSKTDIKGNPQDTSAGGSFIKIEKDGSIEVNDNKASKIRLDKASSNITIETTESNVIINAKKDININADGDMNAEIKGDMVANVGKETTVTSKGRAKVKAPLVELTNGNTGGTDGVVTGKTIDFFTGVNHVDISRIVRAKK